MPDLPLTGLSSKELEALHANTVQHEQSGTPAERRHAEILLPQIAAEVEARIHRLQVEKAKRRMV